MILPNVSTLGLTALLPQVTNVVYMSVRKAGNVTITIPWVVTSPQKIVERSPSYGIYKKWTTTFKIDPAAWLAAITAYNTAHPLAPLAMFWPKSRDYLTVNGLIWQVCIAEDIVHQGSPYRLESDRLVFQLQLDDQVQFVQATCTGSSSAGARTVTDVVSSTILQCAIEPRTQTIEDKFGTKTDPEYFDIYLTPDEAYIPDDSPSLLQAGSLLQDQNSVLYEILETEKRERLDGLLHVLAVKKL